jgi:hypothetical protein
MKRLLPIPVAIAALSMSAVFGQMASSSPTPAGSPIPAKQKHSRNTTASMTPVPGGGPGLVWVNTSSHVYHKQGSRWYGKTKHGKYLSEQEAIKEGDHADPGEAK